MYMHMMYNVHVYTCIPAVESVSMAMSKALFIAPTNFSCFVSPAMEGDSGREQRRLDMCNAMSH